MPQEHKLEITFPAKRISSPSDPALTGNVSVTRLQPDLSLTSYEGLPCITYEAKVGEETKQD